MLAAHPRARQLHQLACSAAWLCLKAACQAGTSQVLPISKEIPGTAWRAGSVGEEDLPKPDGVGGLLREPRLIHRPKLCGPWNLSLGVASLLRQDLTRLRFGGGPNE